MACKNLRKLLMHNGNKDIDAEDLCCELVTIAQRHPKSMPPQGILLFILQQELLDRCLMFLLLYGILLTLPVSLASGEHSFSKLKLINTYVCSTMLQKRLVGLATISIEHAQVWTLDLNELGDKICKGKVTQSEILIRLKLKLWGGVKYWALRCKISWHRPWLQSVKFHTISIIHKNTGWLLVLKTSHTP